MSRHWYHGKLNDRGTLELAIDDPGLLYGATVFTTLRVYQRSLDHPLTAWQAHCDRLHQSLKTFGWAAPNWQQVRSGAETLLEQSPEFPEQFPVLRITLFPDGREWITRRQLPALLPQWQQQGITAWVAAAAEWQRSLPDHKTGNYLTAWLARQTAQQHSAQEAILVDKQGNWLETSTGNLWGWREGAWWTPPSQAGILPGVARSQFISWLKWQNGVIREEPWSAELVSGFEAIAYSNSVVQIVPIHTVLSSAGFATYPSDHAAFLELRQLFQAQSTS